jgi:two-component system response regulator AtoC
MAASEVMVLVVASDPARAERLCVLLRQEGAQPLVCSRGSQALERLHSDPAEIVLAELDLPDMTALDLAATLEEKWPGLPLIVLADESQAERAEAVLQAGAADILELPPEAEQVKFVLGKAQAAVKSQAARPPAPSSSTKAGILGQSAAMRQAEATLQRAAQGTATVLVRGESGTGKELVARAIHDASPRAKQPFVKIDCTALPENLLDSELFGYEKGAFTGAVSRKPGRVELADKGTLFLDEIGELSLPLQAKLLRLLQDKQFERIGGVKTIHVDVRIVAATHRDLETMIERDQFRLDLFYRLNVVPLWLPPLRARREDIELLATHFCKTCGAANGKPHLTIDAEALKFLRSQRWPGNVRQLQNFIERLVVLTTESTITMPFVRGELEQRVTFQTQPGSSHVVSEGVPDAPPMTAAPSQADAAVLSLGTELRAAEKRAIERALKNAKGNRSMAARLLNLSRSTLYAKLQEHGLL